MKRFIPGLFLITMLLVLCACQSRRAQKDPNENVINLATERNAMHGVDDNYATSDVATPETVVPIEEDDELPGKEPDEKQETEVSPYYYISEDGSVGLCNYNDISYHEQDTSAEATELEAKMNETLSVISKSENKEIPELTDALVSKYYDYKSVDELRNAYKKMIEESKEEKAEDAYKNEILSYIVENSSFNSDLTEKSCTYYASLYSYYNARAVAKNMSFDEYVETYYETPAAEFKKNIARDATQLACRTEALLAIAEAEKLEITDEIYEEKIKTYMEKFGYSDRELFEKEYSRDVIEFNILQDLAFEYVLGKAKSL
ncbi:MAG: hypothetical protein J6M24_03270 [Lachnospiraceae bacterium]|nr:hypothetical protein [Lachnospiraceae bacterium]